MKNQKNGLNLQKSGKNRNKAKKMVETALVHSKEAFVLSRMDKYVFNFFEISEKKKKKKERYFSFFLFLLKINFFFLY